MNKPLKIELTPSQVLFLGKVNHHGYALRTEAGPFRVAGENRERKTAHYQVGGALFEAETGDAVLALKLVERDRAEPRRVVLSKRGKAHLAKLGAAT